jgi:hypothetical protein
MGLAPGCRWRLRWIKVVPGSGPALALHQAAAAAPLP